MTLISSSNTSSYCSSTDTVEFRSWLGLLTDMPLNSPHHALFLKKLQNHPEWLNQTNQDQQTALILATIFGRINAVEILLQAGADLNCQDQSGCTALMISSNFIHQTILHALIKAGADLNLQDQKGRTALMHSVEQNHLETVQTLMHQGANSLLMNETHQTALDLAKKKGYDDVIRLLEAHASHHAFHQVINPLEGSSKGVSSSSSTILRL